MSLLPGAKLGPYEIIAPIGAGGMGEVYRARDTRLKRDVALKILPESFALDPERLARFQREAEVLASLNHPNIAHILGLEDANGVRALVMELVEGPTLADRIAQGPIAIEEALPIARQIVEALETAHEQGIIHRDLKPANIKVREDGTVKVLDFGLAKLADTGAGTAGKAGRAGEAAGLTNSPTLTTPAATLAGVVLGTAAYMAPEQARGKPVDKRADIWAFGAVLFEMLTGARAFDGEDLAETIGAVIHKAPAWSRVPAATPASVRNVLQRCLQKDPKQRLRDIGDVRLALDGGFDAAPAPTLQIQPMPQPPLWRRVAVLTGVALALGALAVAGTWLATRPAAPRVTRTTMATTGTTALAIDGSDRDLAITPDGSRVVYVSNNGTQLFVRALDALEPVAIASGRIRGPFVSPDGRWVGFFENNATLKKVAIAGGPSVTITAPDGLSRGGTWLPDDTIVFATGNPTTGLQRVSANGGTSTVLSRPDPARGEADHVWPDVLPGGHAVLFTIAAQTGGLEAASIAVLDLQTNTSTILVRGGSQPHYVASGHLVYTAAGTLRAVPFDLGRLAVHGPAVPVVPRLATTLFGAGDFGVAADGTLVYVDAPGSVAATPRTLVWVDRSGKEEPIAAPPRAYLQARLSPDGTRLALDINDQEQDVWVWDLRRATLTRLTFDPGQDQDPVWTPDGHRIVFSSQRAGGALNLWWQAADGTGTAERLTTSPNTQYPTGVSPDGTRIVVQELTPGRGRDLLWLELDGTHRITPLVQTPFLELNGIVSADGRWLAYESDNSGRFEIYVRPFPNTGAGQWQVSTAGGTRPLWARSGTELFFLGADGALLRAPVEATATMWNAGTPMKLLEPRYFLGGNLGRSNDVSPDGQRFLMIKSPSADATAEPPSIIVVQHFDEELKRLAPAR